MDGSDPAPPVSLLELVPLSRWQRIQDHFSSVLGVPIRTVTASGALAATASWPSGIDVERMVSALKIGEELERLLPSAPPVEALTSFTTPLGMTYAAVPIRAAPQHIVAYFVLGPMIVGPREDELQFRQRVVSLGLDPQTVWPIMLSLKLYTFVGVRSALHLLEEVGAAIVESAHRAARAERAWAAGARSEGPPMERAGLNRLLRSLFEAAVLLTKAEGGSIMLQETPAGTLRIHLAVGLTDKIVRQTHLQPGEGLSGLALAKRAILLVDRETTDVSVRSRMHQPVLASSLVAALAIDPGGGPIGVLNLRTTDPNRRFLPEHVQVLARLLDLAGAAIPHMS